MASMVLSTAVFLLVVQLTLHEVSGGLYLRPYNPHERECPACNCFCPSVSCAPAESTESVTVEAEPSTEVKVKMQPLKQEISKCLNAQSVDDINSVITRLRVADGEDLDSIVSKFTKDVISICQDLIPLITPNTE